MSVCYVTHREGKETQEKRIVDCQSALEEKGMDGVDHHSLTVSEVRDASSKIHDLPLVPLVP